MFLLSPLFLLIVLILKFSGEGEVFFFQERIGQNRNMFKLYKFATMLKDSHKMDMGTVTVKNDPRVLPVGSFLRKTKINELPQLLNIFLGHMSVIGPRPQAPQCFAAFLVDSQEAIIKVKPGLSGIGPIIFRDEEEILNGHRGNLDFYDNVIGPYKGKVEAWYADKQKLYIYFLLIFITIWVIIFPKSSVIWRLFKDLPIPPNSLKLHLNYPFQ